MYVYTYIHTHTHTHTHTHVLTNIAYLTIYIYIYTQDGGRAYQGHTRSVRFRQTLEPHLQLCRQGLATNSALPAVSVTRRRGLAISHCPLANRDVWVWRGEAPEDFCGAAPRDELRVFLYTAHDVKNLETRAADRQHAQVSRADTRRRMDAQTGRLITHARTHA